MLSVESGEQSLLLMLMKPFIKRQIVSFCHQSSLMPVKEDKDRILFLLSGTIFSFLLPLINLFQHFRICGVLDSHFGGRLRYGRPTSHDTVDTDLIGSLDTTKWHRFRHTTVGGPTEYVALFSHTNLEIFPSTSEIQRGIRHVFNAGIRPGPPPKIFPDIRYGVYYILDDRLLPGRYHLPVLCPSFYHSSGTGYRALSVDELAIAHGFPRQVISSSFPSGIMDLPPCQLLLASLDPIWAIKPVTFLDSNPRPSKRVKESATYIPALKRFLSHAWIDETLITATASKADDAKAPCGLWNARLDLLFPGCIPSLEFLRHRLLIRMRKRLCREIRKYFCLKFGSDWAQTLCTHRRSRALGPRKGHIGGFSSGFSSSSSHVVNSATTTTVSSLERTTAVEITTAENDKQICDMASTTLISTGKRTRQVDINKNLALEKRPRTTFPLADVVPKVAEIKEANESIASAANTIMLLVNEADKASEALEKFCWSSWWEWDAGSALFFWRWGEERTLARDGMIPFIASTLPQNIKKGRSLAKDENIDKIIAKLATIIKRGYIQPGYVTSLIDFFAVPKGDDIRLVYNGTSCGLNGATWAPNFWLPYPRTAIRLLDYGFHSVNVDLGEMFLNFPLHQSIQSASGIDLTPFQDKLGLDQGDKKVWYCWKRNWMGARMSPYSSVQFCSLAEEFCRGDRLDSSNPLRWDVIVLNLPGSRNYDPSKPRVYKWDRTMSCLAGDLVIFVDDVRGTGKTIELAWAIARQVCSRFQYLGVQDASRKRKPPTQTPGAWAGSVFATTDTTVTKTVTLDKWNKAKGIVATLNAQIVGVDNPRLGYKALEVARGFLCHLSMTFEVLVPFLKGFHLTLANHLGQRDKEGWKLTDKVWAAYLSDKYGDMDQRDLAQEDFNQSSMSDNNLSAPEFVNVSQHLRDDLTALSVFLEAETPPIINDRSETVQIVRYGFGDASGTGFGSTIQTKRGLKYRIGVWGTDEDGESSNFKELENVVSTIEEEAASGTLSDAALFFFTDNTTVESALYKGNSSSRKLFELVVRFRKIQLVYGMQVIVTHVSGKRMIHQGTDGISRGNMKEGVGSGIDMIQFIPLHLGAVERHVPLLEWIKGWAGSKVEYLSPSDWFTRGHDHVGGKKDTAGFWRLTTRPGIFLWAPPPAAAEAAIEQLRRALIKRQRSTHIIAIPRLLTMEWLKQLNKAADLIVLLPAGVDNEAWPSEMLEPLTLAFVFPFLSFYPWKRKGTTKMLYMARELPRLWKEDNVDTRDFLRKFFQTQLQLPLMSERLTTPGFEDAKDVDRLQHMWGKRQVSVTSFLQARDGDHLMVPFECDTCIFWKLRGVAPNPTENMKDKVLLACIRRMNLDAFWSRMKSTVLSNRDKVRSALKLSESVGLDGPYRVTEAFPTWDHCGYEVAIQMLLASLKPGRYSSEYTQWDTIRKIRTAYSNQFRSSAQANGAEMVLCDDRGQSQRITSDPCASVWFSRFFMGCKRRMGQDWRPNKAMGIKLILELIRRSNDRIDEATTESDQEKWLTFGAYLCTTYVLSLRGVEGLLVDLEEMIEQREKGDQRYFIVALLGKIKGEHHGRHHLLPCVKVTSSEICIHSWLSELMDSKIKRGIVTGPLFSDWSGTVLTTVSLDKMLVEMLEEVYDEAKNLFPPSVTSRDDIVDSYQVFRSLRRSSDSRALEMKVKESDIDIVNRWQKVENAQGSRPTFQMKYHYAQVELLLEPFLRYTFAM